MVSRVRTIALQGIETLSVDVQVQTSNGMPHLQIVGLPDKAVGESKERVRSALISLGLSLPAKRITINLAPADLQKEGSHYDLPIALCLLVAMGVLNAEDVESYICLGELGLDGAIAPVAGVLPAAIAARSTDSGLICPAACGGEASWAGEISVLAAPSLLALINHFRNLQLLSPPEAQINVLEKPQPAHGADLSDIKGQETAKRALEVAAAGGHNLLMGGPPGSGKSMLAHRLPGILPLLDPTEALEVSMVHSVAGLLSDGRITLARPFRDPHHSCSVPALVGGGLRARPGEVSLAHRGVLFLDELPEFSRQALEALRQPLEGGRAVIARANGHVTYPARVQLIAAMNPCRCGHIDDPEIACARAPRCAQDYQTRISGPLFDRIDLHIDMPAVSASDLSLPPPKETSATVAKRVSQAREVQTARFREMKLDQTVLTNADVDGEALEKVSAPDQAGRNLLTEATDRMKLSARGYHRVLRVARTLGDLDGATGLRRIHIAEALSYRRTVAGR